MLLSALLLASVVQAAPAAPPVAMAPPARCALTMPTPTDGQKAPGARPLAKEPRSGLQYAVLRKVDGCPVATPMRSARPAR